MAINVVAIVQARMSSTRFPGKVLADIAGKSMLARVVERVRTATTLGEVAVATSTDPSDDAIVAHCRDLDISCFRGSLSDVLDRYYQCARDYDADCVVRVTSDCPLIESEIIDQVVTAFLTQSPDYASNTIERTYPRGLDNEAFKFSALETAWREATATFERTHVTPFIYRQPDRFTCLSVTTKPSLGDWRWTLDAAEDLAFVREIYSRLDQSVAVTWRDVVELIEREPQLAEINRHIRQKAIEEG